MKGEKRSKFSFHELLVPLQREIEIRSGILLAALHMQCFCLYTQREVTMPDNTQQLRDPRSYQKLLLLLHLHNMVFSPYVVLLQTPHNQTLVVLPQQSSSAFSSLLFSRQQHNSPHFSWKNSLLSLSPHQTSSSCHLKKWSLWCFSATEWVQPHQILVDANKSRFLCTQTTKHFFCTQNKEAFQLKMPSTEITRLVNFKPWLENIGLTCS